MTAGNARLPADLRDGDLWLRLLTVADAPALEAAVLASLDHLRPWMAWAALEPTSPEQRRVRLSDCERDWRTGGDAVLGILLDGELIGGCGLHRRIAPDGLEIGYWLRPEFTGRGLATRTTALLTDAALRHPGITHVEVHHDRANLASGRIPARLGFARIGEWEDPPQAPGEIGVNVVWRVDRAAWAARRARP